MNDPYRIFRRYRITARTATHVQVCWQEKRVKDPENLWHWQRGVGGWKRRTRKLTHDQLKVYSQTPPPLTPPQFSPRRA